MAGCHPFFGGILQARPDRGVAFDADREVDVAGEAVPGQITGEIPRVPAALDLSHARWQRRDGPVEQARRGRAGVAVGAHQIGGQGAATLGPKRDVRPVGPLTQVVVDRVLLLAPVDLDVGGIPVDRGHRQQLQTPMVGQQPQQPLVDHPDPVLDAGQMCCGETLRQLRGGRGRRRRDRLQLLPRGVRAAPVHPDQKVLTGQLRGRHRQQQIAGGHPPAALLDRADLAVQGLPNTEHPIHLGHRGQSGMSSQPHVRGPDQHPATEPAATRRSPRRHRNR